MQIMRKYTGDDSEELEIMKKYCSTPQLLIRSEAYLYNANPESQSKKLGSHPT